MITGNYGFHTDVEDRPWWMVDLEGICRLDELRVFNRLQEDCSARASSLEIWVSSDEVHWDKVFSNNGRYFGGADGNPLIWRPERAVHARFVKLQLTDHNCLHLDEVEVYGHRLETIVADPHAPSRGAGPIAIMTMVYNESVNLPIWIRYYQKAAPNANLYVIDHSSNDGSTDNLKGVTKFPLPRKKLDESDRAFLISSFQKGLLRYFETVIYTDCDELIVANPTKSINLEDHLRKKHYPHASPIGINVIHMIDREPPLDLTRPLLEQRQYGQFHSQFCKPLITRIPVNWEAGCHSCDQPYYMDQDLYLFHIKTIDKDQALRRHRINRSIEWTASGIAAGHGNHTRWDDKRFLEVAFNYPTKQLKQEGAQNFVFDREVERVREEAFETSGIYRLPSFAGPIVKIPEVFRGAF